jgi:DNA-binding response OmpR family regulator
MNILVVEDEPKVFRFLEGALRAEGHGVTCVRTISELKDVIDARTQNIDVIVLDRMIKGGDSLTLLPQLRKTFPDCRILILSAIGESTEKATALDLGADDYVSKPFSLEELTARIRALTRRGDSKVTSSIMRAGDLTIDTSSVQVKVQEKRVMVSQKEYALLLLFAHAPGRVYNRFQILDKVWDTQFDIESNVVEVTIRHLRQKLEEAGSGVKILSRRNVGYWLEV